MADRQTALADEAVAAAKRAGRELAARRGLRAGLAGIALICLGLMLGSDSALSIPFVAIGAVLAAAGLLGPRLSGRFAVEWGASGTVIELRAAVAPPGSVASEQARELPAPTSDPEVVDSTGETIEIEISRLEALVEAAGKPGERPGTA